MSTYTSELCLALAPLPPAAQGALVQALNQRRRTVEAYEMLLLAGGVLGLHCLYLGDRNGTAQRTLLLMSAATLLYTGLALVSVPIMLGAGAFFALNLGLGVRDYAMRRKHLGVYHRRLEGKVFEFLARANKANQPGGQRAS